MKTSSLLLSCALLLTSCASRQRDHFYVLDARPVSAGESRTQFAQQVTLRVSVPTMVDRAEIVLIPPGGVTVLDHERWAAPLADLVTTTLGQDIERRRTDIIVLPRSAEQSSIPLFRIAVEIDEVTARLGGAVSIETHWRVTDARSGKVSLGREVFSSPTHPQSYTMVASALSDCIALLADRLVREIPAG
jgi:uncharacterized lipoprotein YmbA